MKKLVICACIILTIALGNELLEPNDNEKDIPDVCVMKESHIIGFNY